MLVALLMLICLLICCWVVGPRELLTGSGSRFCCCRAVDAIGHSGGGAVQVCECSGCARCRWVSDKANCH